MKKLIFLLICATVLTTKSLHAAGIHFTENKTFKQLVMLAKTQHKLIFLDGYATWCGPCKYLQHDIFTQAKVGVFFNTHFINAAIDMEKGEGPTLSDKFAVTAYPTLFFINAQGAVVHKAVGALDADELIALGRAALDPKKQYYTVKAKAVLGALTPAEFLAWVKTAEDFKEPELAEIIKHYLALPTTNLMQKDVLATAFYHAEILTDAQLKLLQQNKLVVKQTLGIDSAGFDLGFTEKVVQMASTEAFTDSTLNFDTFKNIAAVYLTPSQVALQTQLVKVRYYSYKQQYSQTLDALAGCFDTTAYHIPVENLTRLIEKNSKIITDQNRGAEFLSKIVAFKLSPSEASQNYLLDIACLLIYHQMSNRPKQLELADKIAANTNTPESLKTAVKKYVSEE